MKPLIVVGLSIIWLMLVSHAQEPRPSIRIEVPPGMTILHGSNRIFSNMDITNQPINVQLVITLQTNWVPVETLTGKREVGIVISNTYARVMWNWKTNDYVQESVVVGQPLVREVQSPRLGYFTNATDIIFTNLLYFK